MAASKRGRIMSKFADKIEKNIEELAIIETLDNGKPLTSAREDMESVVKTIRYYAGWCDKIHGDTIPISGPYNCYTKREPVGVVG